MARIDGLAKASGQFHVLLEQNATNGISSGGLKTQNLQFRGATWRKFSHSGMPKQFVTPPIWRWKTRVAAGISRSRVNTYLIVWTEFDEQVLSNQACDCVKMWRTGLAIDES
ncbi:MAG: hypothetical protein JNM43_23190 [Planctomycetaceae bacterium]|nr:hypothetical protein [Planctomycetaceae bacterium]